MKRTAVPPELQDVPDALKNADPDATIPGDTYEQDVCGCHQPMRYCLFPKCGGREQ